MCGGEGSGVCGVIRWVLERTGAVILAGGDISEVLHGFMEPIERPGRVRLTMSGKSAYTPTDSPTPVSTTVTWRTWIASHPHLPPLSC